MKKIKVKIELNNIEMWKIDWKSEAEVSNELKLLSWQMRSSIAEGCGIDTGNIEIEMKVVDE